MQRERYGTLQIDWRKRNQSMQWFTKKRIASIAEHPQSPHISQVGISEQVKTGREGMGLFEHMMEPQASPSFRKLHSTIVTTTLA